MRSLFAVLGLAALGACAAPRDGVTLTEVAEYVDGIGFVQEANRVYDLVYRDVPFDKGAVSVLAEEHGELHTYNLRPCGGLQVCGGTGHVGRAQLVENYLVVTGAYPDRTFYLRPGGDGKLQWRGEFRDLAWN